MEIRLRFALCAAFSVLLTACASHKQLITDSRADPALRGVELDDTPFFPQVEFQCGPAALATALGASGANVQPDTLTPLVYVPEREGSLQIEMQAAPRKFGRLTYRLAPNLEAILSELDASRPVLVLHNYGVPLLPRWHYAVVVGYDMASDTIVLRSGDTRRQVLSAANFMRAWDNAERWALVVLRPGEVPVTANARAYLDAAASFEKTASPEDARLAFDAAVKRWPKNPIAWVGRGTAEYRAGEWPAAARDYEAALQIDANNAGARNNLAMTLLNLGCPARARQELDKITDKQLTTELRGFVKDTRQRLGELSADTAGPDSETCSAAL
jgi:tetratricopeptide (TPR) repeat protein